MISQKELDRLDALVRDGLITSYAAPLDNGTLMEVTRQQVTLSDGSTVISIRREVKS